MELSGVCETSTVWKGKSRSTEGTKSARIEREIVPPVPITHSGYIPRNAFVAIFANFHKSAGPPKTFGFARQMGCRLIGDAGRFQWDWPATYLSVTVAFAATWAPRADRTCQQTEPLNWRKRRIDAGGGIRRAIFTVANAPCLVLKRTSKTITRAKCLG
jgi:hypothetical protein